MIINNPPRAVISVPSTTECDGPGGGRVVLDGSGSLDPDSTGGTGGDIVAFEWSEETAGSGATPLGSGPVIQVVLPRGDHTIGLRVTDSRGEFGTGAATVRVEDTLPPSLSCPGPVTLECQSSRSAWVPLPPAAASDACGVVTVTNSHTSGGHDASGTYPLGTTTVTFVATDSAGQQTSCHTAVTVRDTVPPVLTVVASPTVLWPPNHRMVTVDDTVVATDACDPSPAILLVAASSSESDDALGGGDGSTTDDVQGASVGTPDVSILLRAERDGQGSGRVYTLTYRASDGSGNATQASSTVTVPHDMRDVAVEPLNLVLSGRDSTTVLWGPVEGAQHYDVIRGDLANLRVIGSSIDLGQVVCIDHATTSTTTAGHEDTAMPAPGHVFFYAVQYFDGIENSSYGSESAGEARVVQPGNGDSSALSGNKHRNILR